MKNENVYDKQSRLIKAGGLIVRDNNGVNEILLIRSNRCAWSFPKGHVEKGETFKQAAIRECHEETGLELEIIKNLPTLEYKNTSTGEDIIVYLYEMRVIGGNLKKEFEDVEFIWTGLDQSIEFFEYENQKEYINLIKNQL